jgi:hypothetical protein
MRKLFVSLLALVGLVATLPSVAGAESVVVVDLGVVVSDLPDPVAPSPGTAVYKIEVTNHSLLPLTATVTDTTDGGTIDAGASTLPAGCVVATTSVTCSDVALGATETKVLYVAVVVADDVTNTATVSLSPALLDVLDTNVANNVDTESTTVLPVATTQAGTYLREGETLRFKKHSVTVRDSDTGVIARLADADLTGVACGVGTCEPVGLHADFPANDVYRGYLLTQVNFGTAPPCRGIGATKCHRIFYRTSSSMPMVEVFDCLTANYIAEPGPCVEQVVKSGTEFIWDVRMTSDDPDLGSLRL